MPFSLISSSIFFYFGSVSEWDGSRAVNVVRLSSIFQLNVHIWSGHLLEGAGLVEYVSVCFQWNRFCIFDLFVRWVCRDWSHNILNRVGGR